MSLRLLFSDSEEIKKLHIENDVETLFTRILLSENL